LSNGNEQLHLDRSITPGTIGDVLWPLADESNCHRLPPSRGSISLKPPEIGPSVELIDERDPRHSGRPAARRFRSCLDPFAGRNTTTAPSSTQKARLGREIDALAYRAG
jgi:hypothetical protein